MSGWLRALYSAVVLAERGSDIAAAHQGHRKSMLEEIPGLASLVLHLWVKEKWSFRFESCKIGRDGHNLLGRIRE